MSIDSNTLAILASTYAKEKNIEMPEMPKIQDAKVSQIDAVCSALEKNGINKAKCLMEFGAIYNKFIELSKFNNQNDMPKHCHNGKLYDFTD
jgi:hypothetical protein